MEKKNFFADFLWKGPNKKFNYYLTQYAKTCDFKAVQTAFMGILLNVFGLPVMKYSPDCI